MSEGSALSGIEDVQLEVIHSSEAIKNSIVLKSSEVATIGIVPMLSNIFLLCWVW